MIEINSQFNPREGIDFFSITEDGKKLVVEEHPACPCCLNHSIDPLYIVVIQKLKEAGLLHESYPLVCCVCYAKWGMDNYYEERLLSKSIGK